jgi:hypothetical protein
MKTCKACRKEIDDLATKCPHCQAFQTWKRNPQVLALILPLLFIPFVFVVPFWMPRTLLAENHFSDFQSAFSTKRVNESRNGNQITMIYEIQNDTPLKWSWIRYRMVGKQADGTMVAVSDNSDISWVIQPKSTAPLSVTVEAHPLVTQWDFQITEMQADRW